MAKKPSSHRWKVYRSGGVDQVAIQTADDLANLAHLDSKLWIALSMPTRGVELDARTLDLLDTDKDGFVRQPEVLAAVTWLEGVYKDLATALAETDVVELSKLKDGAVQKGARRLLENLGKAKATAVSLEDATNAEKMFADTLFNGDGVVPAEAAEGEARLAIEDIIAAAGSLPDRSGKPGVDADRIDAYFTDAKALIAWHAVAEADPMVMPLGAPTTAAADAVRAVRGKVEDFFTRCRLAAFDARAATALNPADAELAALSAKELSAGTAEIALLPLARIDAAGNLPLRAGINPGWHAQLGKLVSDAVVPFVGPRDALDERSWAVITEKLAPHETWRAAKPTDRLDAIPLERLRAAVAAEADVRAALAKDLAVKAEVDAVADVERLCRYQRDLATVLDNYVNFSRFYSHKGGVFQAGTLFLDGRGCTLVFEVNDAAKHASLAPMSGAYLAYCDCVRAGGEKKAIAAAFTAGDVDNLFVGRNGVFVDRKGRDWQATITKVVDAPLSIRQAFWAPYKKAVRALEERAAKRAAAAEAASSAKLDGAATKVGDAAKPGAAKPADKSKMDIGTIAAIGIAVGGIAAVLTAILGGVFGLGKWAPLALIAFMFVISAPSMMLAFMKLRRRNLGPLLDANGWAINSLTRINVPFGTSLTDRATLPEGAERNFKDPYAQKGVPWKRYVALILVLALAGGWYFGKLDSYLPDSVQSTTVLGERAPAYKAPAPTPATPAAPAAPPQ